LISSKVILVALNDLEVFIGSERPEVALFDADAAVALPNRLNLGKLDFIDEGAAVAVASVGLEVGSCFCTGGHAVVVVGS
jgi:hypothetical protein